MNLNRYNSIVWAAIGTFVIGSMVLGSLVWIYSLVMAPHGRAGELRVTEEKATDSREEKNRDEFVQIEFPQKVRNLDYLVFPLGVNKIGVDKNNDGKFSASGSGGSFSYSGSYRGWNADIINNFLFRSIDGVEDHLLLNRKVFVKFHELDFMYDDETAKVAEGTIDKIQKEVPVVHLFAIAEKDSNGDGLVNADDFATLYLSDSSGSNLTQLTPDGSGFLEKTYMKSINRLIIKIVEKTPVSSPQEKAAAVIKLLEVDLDAPGIGKDIISSEKKSEIEKLMGVR